MDLTTRGASEKASAAAVPSGEDAASSAVPSPRSPPSAAAATHPETPQDVPESPTVKHTPTSGLTEGDGLSWMSSRLLGGRRIQSHPSSRPTSRGSVSWDPALSSNTGRGPGGGGVVQRERGGRSFRQRSLLGVAVASARAPDVPPVLELEGDVPQTALRVDVPKPAPAPAPVQPLKDRVPSVETVVKEVRSSFHIKKLFSHSEFYRNKADQDTLFNIDLWVAVGDKLEVAITKYTPLNEKDIKKKVARFEKEKRRIRSHFINRYNVFERKEGEADKHWEMKSLLPLIGMEFMAIFQKLITPPGGKARVPVSQLVEDMVNAALNTDVEKLFDDPITAEHVYYIIGFFCDAGSKEALRRSQENDLGNCIQAINQHFAIAREEEKVMKIKQDLPPGLTALVDKRCAFGGLKYPDRKLYYVFAVIEFAFMKLATPDNFIMYGGTLMADVLHELLENSKLLCLFSDLFTPDQFSQEILSSALQYYLKVFGNVRMKDLCYRYNSNIHKGATVGLRPTLAAGGKPKGGGEDEKKGKKRKSTGKGTKAQKKQKQRKSVIAGRPDGETSVRVRFQRKLLPLPQPWVVLPRELRTKWKFELFEAEESKATDGGEDAKESEATDGGKEGGADGSEQPTDIRGGGDEDEKEEEEPEVYDEEEVGENEQHAQLLLLANMDLDEAEDYRKDCTIKRKAKEHMGDTTRDENDTTKDDSDDYSDSDGEECSS